MDCLCWKKLQIFWKFVLPNHRKWIKMAAMFPQKPECTGVSDICYQMSIVSGAMEDGKNCLFAQATSIKMLQS